MSEGSIPFLKLQGTHREIGLQHGSLLKERIAIAVSLYEPYFKRTRAEIEQWSLRARKSLESICPHLIEEIDAIAEASGQDKHMIMALNIRTELMGAKPKVQTNKAPTEHECSTVYFPNQNIIGQNWDWAYRFRNNAVLLSITLPNGHQLLTLTEPGIVAKVGMSSARIATTMTRLIRTPEEHHEIFLPIHILLRLALEAENMAQIDSLVKNFNGGKVGTASTAVVGSTGIGVGPKYLAMELANEKTFFLYENLDDAPHLAEKKDQRVILHTNHYISPLVGVIEPNIHQKSSFARIQRLNELLAPGTEIGECSIETMKKFIGDTNHPEEPICRAFSVTEGDFEIATITSIVMDLNALEMHITLGAPLTTKYSKLRLHSSNL